tara:strand:- start:252 stop:362 length:111 start_codon:yes stop_codon:yes gene_type:complete
MLLRVSSTTALPQSILDDQRAIFDEVSDTFVPHSGG